jgi:DNA modification methylase
MPSLQFKGKPLVQNHHLVVPFAELEAVKSRGLSKTPSLHDNLIIEGDNLKALKALLPTYHGKVKCIYIDPPYNTGNEGWIYNDKVNSPMMRDWLGGTVDRDDLTRHDKWCCMMLPRLKLLRELISDDGVIVVSVDDNEDHRLRMLMDEVFGEDRFLGQICWKSRNTDNRLTTNLSTDHEYLLVYGASADSKIRGRAIDRSDFENDDEDSRGPKVTDPLTGKATAKQRPNLHYDIVNQETGDVYKPDPSRGWITDRAGFERLLEEKRIWWPPDPKTGNPRKKRFLSETKERMPASTFWADIKGQTGADEVDTIMGERVFAFPKSVEILKRVVDYCADPDSIIIDSFAGSGTTAHAVLALNKEDGGSRRFILCQVPYETKEQEAKKENICETITAERVRRVIRGVPDAKDADLKKGLGGTFSYFKLGKELQKQAILDGKDLPSFEAPAGYVFFTATGEEFQPKKMKPPFIGASRDRDVFLIYEQDIEKLKDMALNLELARSIAKRSERKALVFAPTKYLDQDYLDRLGIEFCQLPFEIYQRAQTQ